ncbi:hypothetical protein HD554DRAFT_2147873 [Boletus coccyginus]|nr:hypothetical protein HD554DRAFT_2147873 [Boletus coccyginus]
MANKCALALPVLLYLATVGASFAWLIITATPGAVYSDHAVQVAGLCFWSLSAAMNVCASCIISVRFWIHRRAIMRAVGAAQGTFYLGYMAMTLESALLYTVFLVIALVVFLLNSPLENVFFPVLGTVQVRVLSSGQPGGDGDECFCLTLTIQVIAPALIIYRIARGISLETDERGSVPTLGTLRFSALARPRRMVQSIDHDFFEGSGTMHASSGETAKADRDSFIQEVKDSLDV